MKKIYTVLVLILITISTYAYVLYRENNASNPDQPAGTFELKSPKDKKMDENQNSSNLRKKHDKTARPKSDIADPQ